MAIIEEDEPQPAVSVSILKDKFLSQSNIEVELKERRAVLAEKEKEFDMKERAFAKEEQALRVEIKNLRQREITIN